MALLMLYAIALASVMLGVAAGSSGFVEVTDTALAVGGTGRAGVRRHGANESWPACSRSSSRLGATWAISRIGLLGGVGVLLPPSPPGYDPIGAGRAAVQRTQDLLRTRCLGRRQPI